VENRVLQELNLAEIAEEIDAPYHLVPLVSLGAVDLSVFICEGPKSWHRAAERDECLTVLEGVITLESKSGKIVVGEGEMARIPAKAGLNYFSGMRSTVVLAQEHPGLWGGNGHQGLSEDDHTVEKRNYASEVRQARPFHWERIGVAGGYALSASRLQGDSRAYVVPSGSLVALVYRGVLDYEGPDSSGSVVGSEILVMPGGASVSLRSERGATVLALARKGAPLPSSAA
jgi:mannose-6-phosphate isomerase-like protein (cupin superfamily)